jgi:hypothetical protein
MGEGQYVISFKEDTMTVLFNKEDRPFLTNDPFSLIDRHGIKTLEVIKKIKLQDLPDISLCSVCLVDHMFGREAGYGKLQQYLSRKERAAIVRIKTAERDFPLHLIPISLLHSSSLRNVWPSLQERFSTGKLTNATSQYLMIAVAACSTSAPSPLPGPDPVSTPATVDVGVDLEMEVEIDVDLDVDVDAPVNVADMDMDDAWDLLGMFCVQRLVFV